MINGFGNPVLLCKQQNRLESEKDGCILDDELLNEEFIGRNISVEYTTINLGRIPEFY
jgi:hypothetical protein